jgi:hypothetical protein
MERLGLLPCTCQRELLVTPIGTLAITNRTGTGDTVFPGNTQEAELTAGTPDGSVAGLTGSSIQDIPYYW